MKTVKLEKDNSNNDIAWELSRNVKLFYDHRNRVQRPETQD